MADRRIQMDIIDGDEEYTVGEEYTDGQLRMLMRAVKRVLTCTASELSAAELGMLGTAIHIGLVEEDECRIC